MQNKSCPSQADEFFDINSIIGRKWDFMAILCHKRKSGMGGRKSLC